MNQPFPGADPTKVVFRRILAYFIDGLLFWVVIGGLFFALADLTVIEGTSDCSLFELAGYGCGMMESNGTESIVLFKTSAVLIAAAAGAAYGILFVVITQGIAGWTPGKLICGVRVVNEQGTGPGIGRALIRWIVGIVDAMCSGLVGLIVMLSSKGHRRVGDMAAKTFVVRSSARGTPVIIPGLTTAAVPAASFTQGPMPTTPPTIAPPFGTPQPSPSGYTAAPPQAAGSGVGEPQWDAARNAWIQWDEATQAWQTFDESTKAWKPLS